MNEVRQDVKLQVRVIEVKRDVPYDFNGRSGMSASLRVRFNGVLVKVKARNDNTKLLDDAQANVDKDVTLVLEAFAGEREGLSFRAVSISPK